MEDVLIFTNITAQSRKKYGDVLDKFKEFFRVRKNVIYKRHDAIRYHSGRMKLQNSTSFHHKVTSGNSVNEVTPYI